MLAAKADNLSSIPESLWKEMNDFCRFTFDLDMCARACAGMCRYVSALACTCAQRHTQLVKILKIGSHHKYMLSWPGLAV